jgi:hypothetical protein
MMFYPALYPPVKAPWRRFNPRSSRTSCFQTGTYDPSSRTSGSSGGRGVPKATNGDCCACRSASKVARDLLIDILKAYGLRSPAERLSRVYGRNSRGEGWGEVQPCGSEEENGGRLTIG